MDFSELGTAVTFSGINKRLENSSVLGNLAFDIDVFT